MRFIKKRNCLRHLLWITLWLYHCLITIASSIYVYRISPVVWLNITKCWNCAVYPFIGCLAGRSVTKLTQIDMIFISFNTQASFYGEILYELFVVGPYVHACWLMKKSTTQKCRLYKKRCPHANFIYYIIYIFYFNYG